MRYTRLGRGRMSVILALMLFVSVLAPVTAFAAPAQHNEGNTEWVQVYTVQRGDTLAGIAWSFGLSEEDLLEANSLRNPNLIYVGQQLVIPEESHYGTGGPECAKYYTVRRGDTLSEIALYNGIDEYALARANGIYDLNDVYVGQDLCIPGNGGGNEYPNEYPQEPQRPNYEPNNDGCNPCGQPQNDGPQNDGPKNDGPQRPADEPQRPNYEPNNDGCNPCDQPQNDGPQNDGPKNDGPKTMGRITMGRIMMGHNVLRMNPNDRIMMGATPVTGHVALITTSRTTNTSRNPCAPPNIGRVPISRTSISANLALSVKTLK